MNLDKRQIIMLAVDYARDELTEDGKELLKDFIGNSKKNRELINHYRRVYYRYRRIAFMKRINNDKVWSGKIKGALTNRKESSKL
jgi:hypothetical protein